MTSSSEQRQAALRARIASLAREIAERVEDQPDGRSSSGRQEEQPKPKRRQRKPSLTNAIKQARKAGERGPVRIEITDATGVTIAVTSSQHEQPEQMSTADASRLWDERIAKHAH